MNSHKDFAAILEKKFKTEDYDGALGSLRELEKERPLSARELVVKGRLVQLASEDASAGLHEAEAAFKAALEIDEGYVPALLDLGWFYYAVQDDSQKAIDFFRKAASINAEHLLEAVRGTAECLVELESAEVAVNYLEEEERRISFADKIREELEL